VYIYSQIIKSYKKIGLYALSYESGIHQAKMLCFIASCTDKIKIKFVCHQHKSDDSKRRGGKRER